MKQSGIPVFPENLLGAGDALIIIPPVSPYDHPVLGPHLLQAQAKKAGFQVSLFYAALHFMSTIGIDHYTNMGDVDLSFIGEQIFAYSAYGGSRIESRMDLIYNNARILGAQWPDYASQIKFFHQENPFDRETLIELEETACRWVKAAAEFIADHPFPIVGCSSSFEQNNAAMALLKEIKKIKPQIVTIIGGANCAGEMAEGVRSLDPERKIVDCVFSGEGENSFISFLETPGGEGIIYGEPYTDLDRAPLSDFSDYFNQAEAFVPEYVKKSKSISVPYETSRGCWWRRDGGCSFCGESQAKGYRRKSAEKVLSQLGELKEKYTFDRIKMTDVVMPTEYFEELLPRLNRGEKKDFSIFYEVRSSLTLEQMEGLKKSGIDWIVLGIESFSDELLREMNKGVDVPQVMRALRYAKGCSINVQWNILWGFPDEKTDFYRETAELLPLIRHFQPPRGFFHIVLERFSGYAETPNFLRTGDLQPLESYYAIYPEKADIDALARYFKPDYKAETHDNPQVIVKIEKEIEKWHALWKDGSRICRLFPAGDEGMIIDTRGLPGLPGMIRVLSEQMKFLLTEGDYTGNKHQDWAIENKLAVVLGDRFIPLVTAPVEIMKQYG